ncbi:hypothetical protein NPIL_275061 [Nephila pilipes]|uniref:Uncharacterized protein n=1 Tax=Nephila pilipes TaxID=299642 RepID=A0A8X6TEJ9_NEPPI|nr:hypothetical protein NPIL_275061 [Nephila pilipes]
MEGASLQTEEMTRRRQERPTIRPEERYAAANAYAAESPRHTPSNREDEPYDKFTMHEERQTGRQPRHPRAARNRRRRDKNAYKSRCCRLQQRSPRRYKAWLAAALQCCIRCRHPRPRDEI